MKHIKGDLLEAFSEGKMDAFFQVCNSHNVWGGGIVIPIKKTFPLAYDADKTAYNNKAVELGMYSMAEIDDLGTIFNIYAMRGIGSDGTPLNRNLSYDAFYDASYKICKILAGKKVSGDDIVTIGIPHGIGCCRAGGNWSVVQSILLSLELEFGIEFVIYELK